MKKKAIAVALTCLMLLTGAAGLAEQANTMPISQEPIHMTMYSSMWNTISQHMSDLSDHSTVQAIEKVTGIDFEFITPPTGDDGTFLSMIIASGEYPDIFYEGIPKYSGGVDGALEDGIIIDHNALVEEYAPNYMAIYNGMSEAQRKGMRTSTGMYRLTRFGSNLLNGKMNAGLVIRKDWLDTLGLDVPTTVDAFTEVLRAFKNELGVEVPFAMAKLTQSETSQMDSVATAYGTRTNLFYLDEDGKVTQSFLSPGYKDYLATLRLWMEEGLIDIDLLARSWSDTLKMTYVGKSGVCNTGNWMLKEMLQLGQMEETAYDVTAVPPLRLTDAEEAIHLSSVRRPVSGAEGVWYISSTCEDPVAAIRFIDFLYSEEGLLLATWGAGELEDGTSTYTIREDGSYTFSDWIMNNPDIPYATLRDKYYLQQWTTRTLDDLELIQYDQPYNLAAWDTWSHNNDDAQLLPSSLGMTAEETFEASGIINDVETYMMEMVYKIINGEEPLDNWEAGVERAKEMGLERAVEIYQAAYDRYMSN